MPSKRPLFDNLPSDDPMSVSELTGQIKRTLERGFASVLVEGEISNFSRPRSGHCYLTLKDEGAQLPAVVWRTTAARVRFDMKDGLAVVCRGRIDVYPPHGRYQLVIDRIDPKGLGALELAFRQLHEKLSREGLFDEALKRPLPRFVRRIAVVTSATGAAIRDFLQVLRRRWRGMDVLLVPVRVQGEDAAEEIADGVDQVNRLAEPERPDCLVVTRGGGSLEDLWAFNEEVVVRAIRRSTIPVVSGVGHEIDVTLSDLAADVRALTPSEAAERVSLDERDVRAGLAQLGARMASSVASRVASARHALDSMAQTRVFRMPLEIVHDRARAMDDLDLRMRRAVEHFADHHRQRLASLSSRLDALSPLAVLGRGYSLTQTEDGRLVTDASDLAVGRKLRTRLARGSVVSEVTELTREDESRTLEGDESSRGE